MSVVTVNLFHKPGSPILSFCIPVINRDELDRRIQIFIQSKKASASYCEGESHLVCCELFQDEKNDLFFFPNSINSYGEIGTIPSGKLFLLQDDPQWSFVFVFIPNDFDSKREKLSKHSPFSRSFYPGGICDARVSDLSNKNVSFFVSNNGWLDLVDDNSCLLMGIEIFLVEKGNYSRGLFCKKAEGLSPLERPLYCVSSKYNKHVNVRCFCKFKNFSYQTQIPVLNSQELKQAIQCFLENNPNSSLKREILFQKLNVSQALCFPLQMSLNVPFGGIVNGDLLLCYDENQEEGEGKFKIIFLPDLSFKFRKYLKYSRCFPVWQTKTSFFSTRFTAHEEPTIFHSNNAKLTQHSGKEFHIEGVNLRFVSTISCGFCGLFVSPSPEIPEASTSAQHSQALPGDGSYREREESPIAGPSGVGRRHHPISDSGRETGKSTSSGMSRLQPYPSKSSRSKATATASVPPERKGKAKCKSSSPTPLGPLCCFPPSIIEPSGGVQGTPFQDQSAASVPLPFHPQPPSGAPLIEGVRSFPGGYVPVGAVQQTPLWRPFEEQTSSIARPSFTRVSVITSVQSAQQSRQEERSQSDSADEIDVKDPD